MGGMTARLTRANDFILIGEKRNGKRFIVSPLVHISRLLFIAVNCGQRGKTLCLIVLRIQLEEGQLPPPEANPVRNSSEA
jgi:hypothetical protein